MNHEKIKQLTKDEEEAFKNALKILRERLNEYAVRYGLGDLLDVNEKKARMLVNAITKSLTRFSDANFGTKAYAALIAYREYALGRRVVFGAAARYWFEEGKSPRLLYYAPSTAYVEAEKTKAKKPTTMEKMVVEALRRLLLKPGAEYYHSFVEELTKGNELVLMSKEEKGKPYTFGLFKKDNELVELEGIRLNIRKVGKWEGIIYTLILNAEWQKFFNQDIEVAKSMAKEISERRPVKDRFPYMLGWANSDVGMYMKKKTKTLAMSTSHLWQLAETYALFGWSNVTVPHVGLTLEGPKPEFTAETTIETLDEAIKFSVNHEWLKMLRTKARLKDLMNVKSWDELKRWVAKNWDIVVKAAESQLRKVLKEEELERLLAPEGGDVSKRRKGKREAPRDKQKDGKNVWEELRSRLNALRDKLDDDKIAREAMGPALLLIQAEKLGVNEETLKYFGAVVSGVINGDGYVSAALEEIGLTFGGHEIAMLWAAALAAYDIKAGVRGTAGWAQVVATGDDAAKLAALYFLFALPMLEGDDRFKNHKLYEAVELGAKVLNVSWEGLRQTKSGVAADLTISAAGVAVKYNVYLRREDILLQFRSSDRSRVELAAHLLRLAGVSAEVRKEGSRDVWYVEAYTDMLAAGREELRKALAEIVKKARNSVGEEKAEWWLKKLERGLTLEEGWPRYSVRLTEGALRVSFGSPNPDSIKQEAQRFRAMGLEEGWHFSVGMPEEGRYGYVSVLKEGLAYAAWLSVYGEGEQQRLAAKFVELILRRAWEACGGAERCPVYEKALEIIEEGKKRSSQELKDFKKLVKVRSVENPNHEVTYFVHVKGGEAVKDKTLLRIRITVEVGLVVNGQIKDPVKRVYEITFTRSGNNAVLGRAYPRSDAPGGREADTERLIAVITALTESEPSMYHRKDKDQIVIICSRRHLDGFMRYKELASTIMEWLKETSRR